MCRFIFFIQNFHYQAAFWLNFGQNIYNVIFECDFLQNKTPISQVSLDEDSINSMPDIWNDVRVSIMVCIARTCSQQTKHLISFPARLTESYQANQIKWNKNKWNNQTMSNTRRNRTLILNLFLCLLTEDALLSPQLELVLLEYLTECAQFY